MPKFRVHLIYRDVFDEETETLDEAIQSVKEYFAEFHKELNDWSPPEIFGYEYSW